MVDTNKNLCNIYFYLCFSKPIAILSNNLCNLAQKKRITFWFFFYYYFIDLFT